MKFRNLFLALKYQLPLSRAFRNFFITRNARGMFSKNSHTKNDVPKISYSSLQKAEKACKAMERKFPESKFRPYKCIFCDGFHIGKNRI